MSIAIIDYGSGNLRSAAKAFERAARERNLPQTISVTADAKALAAATHIVLPGVGAFADCLRGVVSLPGMREALEEQVIRKGKPFLGICVGMQLMAERGLEHGTHAGFGWLKGEVRRIEPAPNEPNGASLKIPHMGWNDLIVSQPHPVLDGIVTGTHAYFVHSYHLAGGDDAHRFATVDYGGVVTAAVGRDNLFGTQFHPEKSQAAGLRLIANFIRWRP